LEFSNVFLYTASEREQTMTDILSDYEKAMSVIDGLSGEYQKWVRADLDRLEKAFNKAKDDKERREELIREDVFRAAHDMKGQGATFGYELITTVGNHLCRYIEKQDQFKDKEMSAVETHIRFLRQIIEEKLTGQGGEKGSKILKEIEVL